jgi:hypothetical protein
VAQSKAPSSRFHLARGLTPPSRRFRLARGPAPPSSWLRLARGFTSASLEAPSHTHLLPHAGTDIQCSDMAEPRHHAPGNHTPALFRQLPRGNPSPLLWGTVRYGQCQPCGTVLPTPVRLTRCALEGGPAAPSNPSLVNLQGQTMTSGRRERHPRPCSTTPGTATTTPVLLSERGRDTATSATVHCTDCRQQLPRARLRTPRPTTTPSPSKPPLFK